ncbi:MAG: biopolymer transporter ExbD [Hyphomicrobiales bacterium]|nr:biopolymer transporter ExbD [Hyphomicrobiales bacterium]
MSDLRRRRRSDDALPDVTPILDMVFILLIFFVLAAAFAIHGDDVRLPQSSSARLFAGKPIRISIAADGSLSSDHRPITVRDIGFLVREASREDGGSRRVLLETDRDAPVGAFLTVVDTIRSQGGDRMVIAAEPLGREARP